MRVEGGAIGEDEVPRISLVNVQLVGDVERLAQRESADTRADSLDDTTDRSCTVSTADQR